MTKPIRLLIVDDHEVVRLGLQALFTRHESIELLGEARTGAEAIDKVRQCHPDVVLLDLRLPDRNGIDVCREIREIAPDCRVLFLTSYVDHDAVLATIMAGAQGYLLKEVLGDGLIRAVEDVAAGKSVLDPAVTGQVIGLVQQQGSGDRTPGAGLSAQERRIMELIVEGKTNKEIGAELGLSEKTVRNYLSSVFHKLGVSRRSQAAVTFIKQRPF